MLLLAIIIAAVAILIGGFVVGMLTGAAKLIVALVCLGLIIAGIWMYDHSVEVKQ